MIKKTVGLLTLFFFSNPLFAQPGADVEMADAMRQNGKIYVVVAVVLTILIGLFLYLVRIDRKISKLEKKNNNS